MDVIGWLPPNIETMIVVNKPVIPTEPPDDSVMSHDLQSAFASFAAGPLAEYRDSRLYHALSALRIRFTVEGARNFRPPRELGLCPYDGVHLLIIDERDSTAFDQYMRQVEASDGDTIRVANVRVKRLSYRSRGDDWSVFVGRPSKNVLAIATAEDILTEAFARLRNGGTSRAFPDTLREWSGIDSTAALWAMRHYRSDGNPRDPTTPITMQGRAANLPDSQAIGFSAYFTTEMPQRFVAHYYTANPLGAGIATELWAHSDTGARVDAASNGASRITAERGARYGWTPVLFMLLGLLGHAVYV